MFIAKGRLAHGRAARNDDEIARLEPEVISSSLANPVARPVTCSFWS